MLSERWIKKYARMAKTFGEDDNRCYSRSIGTVLVNPEQNRVLSMGINGPPRSCPPMDSAEYLREVFWPQLSFGHQLNVMDKVGASLFRAGDDPDDSSADCEAFVKKAAGCKTCPRRFVGAKSGELLELCQCEHAERNAVYNASCDLHGAWAFCWCGVPCVDCARAFIQAGIKKIYCLEDSEVSKAYGLFRSHWMLKHAGIEVVQKPESYYLESVKD